MEPEMIGKPVRTWREVTRETFEREIVPLRQPAVMRGLVDAWPVVAASRRSPVVLVDYLAAHDSGAPLSTYVGAPEIAGKFFYRDDMRGFNFDRGSAPFRAVANMLLSDPTGQGPAIYSGAAAATNHFPTFSGGNPMGLLDEDVAPRLWIGNAVTVSTHYDLADNIACVAAGNRQFTLFPPDQVGNLYVGPLENTISGQPVSMVDPLAPDLSRFPRFAEAAAHAYSAELEPGDAIYVPTMWWHHVRSTAPFNLLVNYWWSAPNDGSAFEALIHAMLSIRNRPADERAHWRAFFDHYVFDADPDDVAHLPAHARGILGPSSPERTAMMREFLLRGLARGV
jgi:hypothetical protein